MKILIAVPTFENILPETFRSIWNLDKDEHDVDFDFVKGYDCAKARNDIAKRTVDGDYDAVLMIDSDIVVPSDALVHLAEDGHSKGIVLGAYPHKNTKTHEAELFRLNRPNFVERLNYSELGDEPRIRVKGGGMGCAFIWSDVFKNPKMKFPWFKYVIYDNGNLLSEDLSFCSNANRAGVIIEADTRVKCGHMQKYLQYD